MIENAFLKQTLVDTFLIIRFKGWFSKELKIVLLPGYRTIKMGIKRR